MQNMNYFHKPAKIGVKIQKSAVKAGSFHKKA